VDAHTIEKLEFDQIRRALAEHAQCQLGRQLALRVVPSRRESQVRAWLQQAEQFTAYVAEHGLPPFGGVRDVRELVRRAVPPAKLEPGEFADLAGTLEAVHAIRQYAAALNERHELVAKVVRRMGDFQAIAARIHRVIDTRGAVRDDASERLHRLRDEIEDVRRQTREVFDRLLRQQNVVRFLQYANATFHADRMVLPLKAEQRGRIPGIVHRSSDSGQTLFVEPAEAVELNNRRVGLLQEEQDEINRILWELTHLVHLNQAEVLRTLEAVAVLDLLTAKVRFAERYDMTFAAINADHKLVLHQARNPILLLATAGPSQASSSLHVKPADGQRESLSCRSAAPNDVESRSVVPIDVRLGDDFDVLMITGPNTGGKTAALKTVGLLALMTHAGLPIPASAGATVPLLENVWIDVGDEQSLEQSLSTFSGHLSRILDILRRARRSTLVLLDELGAGTDPEEGAAIGRSIVEHLLESGCLAMITTHLGALKALGYEKKRVDNACVEFDLETLRPTYRLRIGEPGNSNAIAIASRLGMPRRLVQASRRYLANQHRVLARAIAGTLESRREAERARRDAELARQEAARATLAALDRARALEQRERSFADWMEKVIRLQAGDQVFVRPFDRPGRIVRIKLEKQLASVDLGAMEVDVPLAELIFSEQPAAR